MSALLGVICFSIGQYLVLRIANNTPSSDWKLISPNVWLSILNNLSNLLVVFAIGNGIAIAWWRKARHSEATKEKLQKSWEFSNSSYSFVKHIRHLNVIALTAIMAKIAVIDGVLFQKAIGTYTPISWETDGPPSEKDSEMVHAFSQTTLPITGYMSPTGMTNSQTEYNYSVAITNWLNVGSGTNADDYVDHCDGVACVYGLKGAGFAIDCNTTNITDTFVNSAPTSGSSNKTIFSVSWDWHSSNATKDYSSIIMNAMWPAETEDGNACPTIFTNSRCEFRPAKLNYTVAYTNAASIERSKQKTSQPENQDSTEQVGSSGSQLSYSCAPPASAFGFARGEEDTREDCREYNPENRQIVGVEVIEVQDIYEPYVPNGPSSLAGIFNALRDQFTSQATLTYNNGEWSIAESGALAPIAEGPIPIDTSLCNYTYLDPTFRIISRLNTLMLQTSVNSWLYPNATTETDDLGYWFNVKTPTYQYYKDIYYIVNFDYSFVALGLTLLVVACILPSYWEFWTLEKKVTLEPFEIAYSLRHLILTDANGGRGEARSMDDKIMHSRV